MSNFPSCSLTTNTTSHSMKNLLAFHIAFSDERWLCYQLSLPPLYISLQKVGRMYFFNLGVKGFSEQAAIVIRGFKMARSPTLNAASIGNDNSKRNKKKASKHPGSTSLWGRGSKYTRLVKWPQHRNPSKYYIPAHEHTWTQTGSYNYKTTQFDNITPWNPNTNEYTRKKT